MRRVSFALGMIAFVLSAYFFVIRFDVLRRIMTTTTGVYQIGELLLPTVLLVLAIAFSIPWRRKK